VLVSLTVECPCWPSAVTDRRAPADAVARGPAWLGRSPAERPFHRGEVDHPAGEHEQRPRVSGRFAGQQNPGRVGQGLGARPEADRVGAGPSRRGAGAASAVGCW